MINNGIKIANKDLKLLLRDKTFIIILLIFFLMSLVSTYISWSSQNTVLQVYNEASKQLIQEGKPIPPDPFASIPPLSLMKNMIIYVALIGALLAITLGHIIAINDRRAGVTRILFSKSFSKESFFLGKILVSSEIIFLALLVSMIMSIGSIALMSTLSLTLFFDICVFYLISFLYLAGFAYISIFFGLIANNSAKAILLPLVFWIIITFALPEFGSALYPTSSLNPVLPATNILDSPLLKTTHSIVYPFSISEQYKESAATTLGLTTTTDIVNSDYTQEIRTAILFIWFIIALGLSYYSVKKFKPVQGDDYE